MLPDVPTASEAGAPGLVVTTWNGVLAPAGTPPAIVERLHKEVTAAANLADVKERYATAGAETMTLTADQFRNTIQEDYARWAKVIKQAGITAE